jgi:hypothetical protein
MTTNKAYTVILETMPEGLEKKILNILLEKIAADDHSCASRRDLIIEIFHIAPPDDLSSCYEDRQIRIAIQKLIDDRYPVISNSGKGGYRLEATKSNREAYIIELESRKKRLEEKIKALLNADRLDEIFIQPSLLPEG